MFMDVTHHWTKMYPIAFIILSPLSALYLAWFPQVWVSLCFPPTPKPILELQVPQSFWSFPKIPTLALEWDVLLHSTFNPFLKQLRFKDAWVPTKDFQVLRPSEVALNFLSAISECKEFACLETTTNLICWPIFIPRQNLEKEVFQLVATTQSPLLQGWTCRTYSTGWNRSKFQRFVL